MVLVCNVCKPEANKWDYTDKKGLMIIAKWYPGGDGAYFRYNTDSMGEEFEKFIQDHAHPEVASEFYSIGAGQENPIRLEYESVGLPKLEK